MLGGAFGCGALHTPTSKGYGNDLAGRGLKSEAEEALSACYINFALFSGEKGCYLFSRGTRPLRHGIAS